MADRSTFVTIGAKVDGFLRGVKQAETATKQFSKGLAADAAKNEKAFSDLGTSTLKWSKNLAGEAELLEKEFSAIGGAMLGVGAAIGVGVGIAVAKFAEFDQAMSQVKAATQESTENMGLLREAALQAGADTKFSATEAANAIEEMGKAGVSTKDILAGGLDGALSLAAAGNLEVGQAAEIAATAMNQFGLEGKQIPHIADLLAAGAGKAAGEVTDMAGALNQVGLVANQTGLTVEETTGTLAAFAQSGLIGSDAGTSFKTMLQRLVPTTKEAREAMKELGISAFNSSGEFIGMEKFAGNLQDAMKDLTAEQRQAMMATIFGSDAVRAASVIYENGAEGIAKWNDEVNQTGYASKVAADRLDNLAGDVEYLGGSLDTVLIKSGSGANDVLRSMVQAATGLVDAIGSLPGPVLGTGLAVAGLAATAALAGGAFLVGVPKVVAFKKSLDEMSISGGRATRIVGGMATGIAAAGAILTALAARQAEATANTREFTDSLDQSTGELTSYTRELVARKLAEGGAYEVAKKAGVSQKELTDAVIEGGKALDTVRDKISGVNTLGNAFDGTAFKAGFARESIDNIASSLDNAEDGFVDTAAAGDQLTGSTADTADAMEEAAKKAEELQNNLDSLISSINAANGVNQDAVSANAAWQEGLAGIGEEAKKLKKEYEKTTGSTKGFSLSLDENTLAGSQQAAALTEVAKKAQDAAQAQFEVDQTTMGAKESTDKLIGTLKTNREAFIQNAIKAGYNADEVQKLADKVYALPDDASIKILADTANAAAGIDRFIRDQSGRTISLRANVSYSTNSLRGVPIPSQADGGAVLGIGGPRQDNLLRLLSNGEHVLDARDVDLMGGQAGVYRFRELLNAGVIPKHADGGAISRTYVAEPRRFAAGGGSVSSAPADVRVYLVPSQGAEKFVDARITVNGKQSELRLRNGVQR